VAVATTWHVRGSYFESCSCDPISEQREVLEAIFTGGLKGTCGYASTFDYSGG
jgi:hypothetical protein